MHSSIWAEQTDCFIFLEMSWGRVEHPKKVFKVGDQGYQYRLKEINGSKIALSMKFDDANPWKTAAEKYAVGNVVTGRVARNDRFWCVYWGWNPELMHFSMFPRLLKSMWTNRQMFWKAGEEITAKVVDFSETDRKISLSIKAMLAPRT